jgi:YD repeat-containing protein
MNEELDVRGNVLRLEQRTHHKFSSERLARTPNDSSFDLDFSTTGQVLRKTLYTYDETLFRSTQFEYDVAGRLTRTEDFDGARMKIGSSELLYSEGRCAWIDRDATGIIVRRGLEEYVGERLIRVSSFDSHDKPRTNKTFEYSDNRLARANSRYYLPDGTLGERWLTEYDSGGRVVRTYGLKADGSPLGDGKYSYEYDGRGRRAKVWTYNEFDGSNTASSVSIYEYVDDELGNWIEQCKRHLWRNDSYESKTITTRKLTYHP